MGSIRRIYENEDVGQHYIRLLYELFNSNGAKHLKEIPPNIRTYRNQALKKVQFGIRYNVLFRDLLEDIPKKKWGIQKLPKKVLEKRTTLLQEYGFTRFLDVIDKQNISLIEKWNYHQNYEDRCEPYSYWGKAGQLVPVAVAPRVFWELCCGRSWPARYKELFEFDYRLEYLVNITEPNPLSLIHKIKATFGSTSIHNVLFGLFLFCHMGNIVLYDDLSMRQFFMSRTTYSKKEAIKHLNDNPLRLLNEEGEAYLLIIKLKSLYPAAYKKFLREFRPAKQGMEPKYFNLFAGRLAKYKTNKVMQRCRKLMKIQPRKHLHENQV